MTTRARLGAALVVLLVGCGDGGQPPSQVGDLLVSYSPVGGPEAGVILLTISGGEVQNVTPLNGQQVSFAVVAPGTTRVIVTTPLTAGDILRLRVPDVTQSTHYTAVSVQVADKVTFALLDPSDHTFFVHR
jgi:hypothetical protein